MLRAREQKATRAGLSKQQRRKTVYRWIAQFKANRHWLAAGFLSALMLLLLFWYSTWRSTWRGISEQKATGLAAVASSGWDPVSLWQIRKMRRASSENNGVVGGVPGGVRGGIPGGVAAATMASMTDFDGRTKATSADAEQLASREIVRTTSLRLLGPNPAQSAERVQEIARDLSGFVVKSNVSFDGNKPRSAEMLVRVPAGKLDAARERIKASAQSVVDEITEAEDVTKQHTEESLTLENLRAEESQYRTILRRAGSIHDVAEVTDRLANVRQRIESLEAEQRDLVRRVELSLINVSVTATPPADVVGIQWSPLLSLKHEFNDALSGLADYADSMMGFVLYLPVLLIWTVTVFLVVRLAWELLKRLARLFFPSLSFWRKPAIQS